MNIHQPEYDVVRILATIGVIAIHADVITSSPTNYLGGLSWWFVNTIHSLAVVSVPLFVMLTGSLLLKKKHIYFTYAAKKVLVQFLLPFVFWWWLSLLYQYQGSMMPSWLTLFFNLFTCNVGHLYYLFIATGLYLTAPFILPVWNGISNKKREIVLLSSSLVCCLATYANYLVFKTYDSTNLLIIWLPFTCYLLWGNVLSSRRSGMNPWLLVLIILVCVGIISGLTYVNILAFNNQSTFFWTPRSGNLFFEPFTFPVFICSLACFSFLLRICRSPFVSGFLHRHLRFIQCWAEYTFGIYLIHPFVLAFLDTYFRFAIHLITYPLWIYYLIKITLAFLISAGVVFAGLHIPIFRLLVGKHRSA